MKNLAKKCLVLVMALTILAQMNETVLAASISWTEDNSQYEAYVVKGPSSTHQMNYSGTTVYHQAGTSTGVTLAKGRTLTCGTTEEFPSKYSSQLYTCMSNAGYKGLTVTVTISKQTTLIIKPTAPTGDYVAYHTFTGFDAKWGVLRISNNGTPSYLYNDETFFVPTGNYAYPEIAKIS